MEVDRRKLQASLTAIAQQADAALDGSIAILRLLVDTGKASAEEATRIADVMAQHLDLGNQYKFEQVVGSFVAGYHTPMRRDLAARNLGGVRLED